MHLQSQIDTLANYIVKRSETNLKVSKSTIGWQIDHSLQAIFSICKVLEKSNPQEFKKGKFNFDRWVVMTLRWIPRGRGKSPEAVNNKSEIKETELQKLVIETREKIDNLNKLSAKAYFEHPFFGIMNKRQAIRFMEIHTHHHLKIIKDILSK